MKILLRSNYFFYVIGLSNLIIFHISIYQLFFFLYDSQGENVYLTSQYTNLLLIMLFIIPHTLLLLKEYKLLILSILPKQLLPTLYGLHASLSLIILMKFWYSSEIYMYQEQNWLSVIYILSWILIFWSMYSIGLFKQSGIESWISQIIPIKINRARDKGPFKYTQYPIYYAFIGMLWSTPNMDLSRFILAISWTIYILLAKKKYRMN
jgi:methanethiol S-methyltransferase